MTAVNGFQPSGWSDLRLIISGLRPGTQAAFSVVREGKALSLRVPVAERPKGY